MVRRLPSPDAPSTFGVVVLVGVLLALLFPYFESTRNANERPRLLQGMALVDDGEWFIDGPARALDPGPDTSKSASDGHLYPNKPPATSLVAAAAYRCARAWAGDEPLTLRAYTWWARLLGSWLPTVVLCAFLLRRWSVGSNAAAAAVLMYALGTPAAAYAHVLYGHQLAAMCLGIGVPLLLDACDTDPGDGRSPEAPPKSARRRTMLAIVGGVLAGAAVTVEYTAAFAALPLGVAILWGPVRSRSARARPRLVAIGVAIAAACVPVVALMAYHASAFGSPWATGYHHATNATFAAKHAEGLLGLSGPTLEATTTHLLSADAGLLWFAPLLPLAIVGLVRLARWGPHRVEARVHLALVLLYLLVTVSLSFEGGWRVGPRYVVLVLPSLTLGLAWGFGLLRDRPLATLVVVALGVYAIVVNQLAANLWPHIDPTNIEHAVGEVLLPLWDADVRPYGALDEALSLDALWIAIAVAVIAWLASLVRLLEPGIRSAIAIALGIALGLALVHATRSWPKHPKGERNLAYILKQWEPPRGSTEAPPSAVLVAPGSAPSKTKPTTRDRDRDR